jgi:hypothetical protein
MRPWISMFVAAGLILGVVVPRLAHRPHAPDPPAIPSPDPALWTFDRSVEHPATFAIARARGQVHEDPLRRRLREAVLTAASRLEFSPCDKQLRPPLRQAIGALLLELRATAEQKVETATINGADVDATAFLNTAVAEIIGEARHVGLVYREDLPPAVGILFPSRPPYADSGRYGGRFTCDDAGHG